MKKTVLWAGAACLGLLAIIGICAVVLANFDWNRAKPWLGERIGSAIGRPFAIAGNLSVEWGRPSDHVSGWRGWVPWPSLAANDVRIGQPEGFPATGDMATAGIVVFSLNPLALLKRSIVVPTLALDAPKLSLARLADGRNNWTFEMPGGTAWQVELDTLVLSKGSIRIVDAIKHADAAIDVDTLSGKQAAVYGIAWKLAGTYNKAPIRGTGRAGRVLSLRTQTQPYPIDADLHAGKTHIAFTGTLTKPSDLAALDLRLKLSGASMAQLFPLIGVPMPETQAYSTDGRLQATLGKAANTWTYEKFAGKVGASDLAGTLEYRTGRTRPTLKGEMVSNLLNFADLAPVVGADSHGSKVARGVADAQPAGKVLPVEPFKTDRWRSVDVDVKFTGRRIVRDKSLPVENLATRVQVVDGVLSLVPLDFGIAGGTLRSTVRLDGRAAVVKASMDATARGLNLKQLFPTIPGMQASLGAINGEARLAASGNSVALLLASSSGELKASMRHGTISKLLLDQIGLNIGSVILGKLFGDKEVKVNCAVGDFAVANGVMQARSVVVDTAQSTLVVEGRIDLARELLDLKLRPASKNLRLISFTGPLYVTGSFASPRVDVDRASLALKAASAVALAVLAPVAALIPVTTLGHESGDNCAGLIAAAGLKPDVPRTLTQAKAAPP